MANAAVDNLKNLGLRHGEKVVVGLTAAKDGCSPQGQCGCCTVLVDGQAKVACAMPADRAAGRSIVTLEGVDARERQVFARSFAVRSIAKTFEDYPNVGALLPAMGYGRQQMEDLKATIEASGAELVLIGTPIDLRKLIPFDVPALRVTYRLQEVGEPTLAEILGEHGLIGDKALV